MRDAPLTRRDFLRSTAGAAATAGALPAIWEEAHAMATRAVQQTDSALPHRVFAASRFAIDEVLTRPYDPDVPMGCVGARLWASSPQGWAFRDDVHWLYLTNLNALDLEVRDFTAGRARSATPGGLLHPAEATYYPSHVQMRGTRRAVVASASFTYTIDNAQNPLTRPFRPEKRWTCWSSGRREDWWAVDFGVPRRLVGLRVWFFDDTGVGACRPPAEWHVEQWVDGEWQPVEITRRDPEEAIEGENVVEFEEVETERVRLVFRHVGENFYTGLYGFEAVAGEVEGEAEARPLEEGGLEVRAEKLITGDDALVCLVHFRNPTQETRMVEVRLVCPLVFSEERPAELEPRRAGPGRHAGSTRLAWHAGGSGRLHEIDVQYRLAYLGTQSRQAVSQERGSALGFELGPGEEGELRVVLAIDPSGERADEVATSWLRDPDPLARQRAEYQAWYDANIAYFDCSDPWIAKLYYHRAYLLRKNLIDPRLGRMQWKTFSEGRWRAAWYSNVISYGAGHQIREARWLRDPSHWQGHLRTFAENEKADGVYPSHVRPDGSQGSQYTDWITSTAWDGYLVHSDREFLGQVADRLAANVRGWQTVYDPDGDGLLLVDSHWWTGMEWQPSFFAFSEYRTDPADRMHPLSRDRLERVDLTSYNYGNAVAVARMLREIGRDADAREFDELAGKIRRAVARLMWDPEERFFYSLRWEDKEPAPVKEVIGVYPFYFGMFSVGEAVEGRAGFEQAWASLVDREQFWTPWPVASASQQCPAYSQEGWPTDAGGSGCMWNGPTWPHANSLVLSAMARTLREVGVRGQGSGVRQGQRDQVGGEGRRWHELPVTREHFWELFTSFTRAQFRDQDLVYPWTGEFYHGETGAWKTSERDYFHSTWLDVLISGVVGLVPRNDDVLEIDPLVPAGQVSHFVLDGQHYRGRDVTVVWDDPESREDHYGDGRKGLDVYVDGELRASAERLERLVVELVA